MQRRRFNTCAVILGVGLALTAQVAAAQTRLLMNMFIPRNHHVYTDVLQPWVKQVEEATQGRVKIEFSASSLAPIPRQFDMVKNGIADIALDQTIFNAKRFELVKLVEFPFTSDNAEAVSVALWRTYERYFAKAGEYEGVKVLSFVSTGASHLWTSKGPVTRLEDAKGLKIRMSSVYTRELASALGIAPVAEPGPKAYELVANGVVDGSAFSFVDIANFKLTNQLRFVTEVPGGLYSAGFAVILNEAKWNGMSRADQDAVMSVSGEALSRLSGKAWNGANDRAAEQLRKDGTTFSKFTPEEFNELKSRLAPIEADWLASAKRKGVDGPAALAYFREQLAAIEKAR